MFHSDLDKLAAKMPAWNFAVTINGARYAVRQPTLAEDEQLSNVKTMKDGPIIALMWSLFEGPAVPNKAHATRDTMIMFYSQLLLHRKARQAMQQEVLKGIVDRAQSAVVAAVVAAVHPASPVTINN